MTIDIAAEIIKILEIDASLNVDLQQAIQDVRDTIATVHELFEEK
jgi:hypothetical protein